MTRPEADLTEGAKAALLACNTQTGSLPQGTPDMVALELRDAGLISRTSMTIRGRAARGRLLDAALEDL